MCCGIKTATADALWETFWYIKDFLSHDRVWYWTQRLYRWRCAAERPSWGDDVNTRWRLCLPLSGRYHDVVRCRSHEVSIAVMCYCCLSVCLSVCLSSSVTWHKEGGAAGQGRAGQVELATCCQIAKQCNLVPTCQKVGLFQFSTQWPQICSPIESCPRLNLRQICSFQWLSDFE